ncbi:MAG: two-component sensor histidine kinase [Rhodospirillaceae bacterium]|nr:two-component sensor histidine kinase [Rhodospirillaceae bacterium]
MRTPIRFRIAVKRYLPKSFLGRSIMIIITPLILVQVVSTWVFYDRHWSTITRRLSDSVAGEIGLVINARSYFADEKSSVWIMKSAGDMGLTMNFKLGKILPNAPPLASGGILDTRLANSMRERVRRPVHIDTWSHERLVQMKVQLPNGVMEIFVPRERLFSSTTYIFLMWMVGTSLLLFAVATIFMRNQVRPIRRLAAAVDNFGKGRDVPDFRPEGATEIRLAAAAFARMRGRINNALTQRTEMLAGVSHDLRTPLTRMKLQLAMLSESRGVADLKDDLREMEVMVEEFLAFARGEGTEEPVESDLAKIVTAVARGASMNDRTVNATTMGDLAILIRPNAIRRCITNLVVNALTHAETVEVTAIRRGTLVEIVVDDNGPGIPEDQHEAVFKPFYRLDASRNPGTGGTGLGLSIARDLARGSGGDVSLAESNLGGLRATITLPI